LPEEKDRYSNIPVELRLLKQWVIARVEPDPTPADPERKSKHPRSPYTGQLCSVYEEGFDPQTLSTFDEAAVALEKFNCEFVGFCFMGSDYRGLDFDKTRHKKTALPNGDHLDVMKAANSYEELSQSRRGYHVIVHAPGTEDPDALAKRVFKLKSVDSETEPSAIEIFYEGFFVFTGNASEVKAIRTLPAAEFQKLVALAASKKSPDAAASNSGAFCPMGPAKLKEVIAGDWQPYYPSASDAMTPLLAALLVEHGLDAKVVDAEFRKTGFFEKTRWKTKWDRLRDREIARALPSARQWLKKIASERKPSEIDPATWPNVFTAISSWKLPPVEPIIDELLNRRMIHLVTGPWGGFKTMAVAEIVSAILEFKDNPQRKAFNHFAVRHSFEVLFLSPDNPPELTVDYLQSFRGLAQNERLRGLQPDLTEAVGVDDPRMKAAVAGRVLVLDTMLDYASIKDAFQSKEWKDFFQKLRALITVHGGEAIILVAHPTKAAGKEERTVIDPMEFVKDSITVGGSLDVIFAFKPIGQTSEVDKTHKIFVQRIKGRGFKRKIAFTIASHDERGDSYIDRGQFPVIDLPESETKLADHVGGVKKESPERKAGKNLIRQYMAEDRGYSKSKLARQLSLELKCEINESTAYRWEKEVSAELVQEAAKKDQDDGKF
jgi:hypothetical protein